MSLPGVCTSTGTEIAYWLSVIRKRMGALSVAAVVRASQNSPWLVVPSPEETYTTSSSWKAWRFLMSLRTERKRPPSEQPTACKNCVPVGLDCDTTFARFSPQWAGIWRPPEFGSAAAATASKSISVGVMPRVSIRARSR